MTRAIEQHTAWCSPDQCDAEAGVHNGEHLTMTPTSIGWSPTDTIEVYASWAAAHDGYPAEDPVVYLYANADGPLTAEEARRLAVMLVKAADVVDGAGR